MLTTILRTLALGVANGLEFNPLFAIGGAIVAAALAGSPRGSEARRPYAVAVLLLAWLVGDGLRVIATARGGYDGGHADTVFWVSVVTWGLVSLLVGYVVPALAGITVGRAVTHGTGWLSAIVVAAAVSGALAWIAPALATSLTTLARAH
ncbi:MAG: hypothetical protein Q7W30_06360 [Coriobacteriia bacterium]|nr:hypothetical protein [Coriobacteriia bacterium]